MLKAYLWGRGLYRHCKNLMSRFFLEGGYRHSGPTYDFNGKSFINGSQKGDNSVTVSRIIAIGQLVAAN